MRYYVKVMNGEGVPGASTHTMFNSYERAAPLLLTFLNSLVTTVSLSWQRRAATACRCKCERAPANAIYTQY